MAQRLQTDLNLCHVIFLQKSPVYQKTAIFSAFGGLLLFVSIGSMAQDLSKIDSLKRELKNGGNPKDYTLLWSLAYELFDFDNDQALTFAERALAVARDRGSDSLTVVAGRLTGQLLRRANRPDDAVKLFSELRPLAERLGMDAELAKILNTLAIIYTFRAEYDKALEYNFQSLVIREKEGDKEKIGIALVNIGLTYYKMGNFDLAVDYNLKAKRAYEDANVPPDITLLLNIGLCYNELGSYQLAQQSLEAALKDCGQKCGEAFVMEVEFGLGNSLFFTSQWIASREHYKASLAIASNIKDVRYQLENTLKLASVALSLKDMTETRRCLDLAKAIPEKSDYREILKGYYKLEAEYFKSLSDYKEASYYLQRVNEVYDTIFSTTVIRNLTKVQTQYAQRENLAIIAEKNSVLALNEQIIKQQRSVNVLLGVIVALTTALVIVVYLNYRKIKAVNAELATAKQIIEDHNRFLDKLVEDKTKQLVDTNEQLVKVNDELDNFIYKTSHDIRGPLASLKGMVNLAIMDVKDDKALGYLTKLDLTAEKLNMILTRLLIVNRINHAELKPETIHFEPIIQEILTLEVKKGIPPKIKVDYEVAPDTHLVSDKDLIRLILENLIDNAVKYYNDSERVESFVRIHVGMENGLATARVMDNGVGISKMNRDKIFQMFVRASERSDTGGIGLYLAKLATEKVGGEISLISTDEQYTEFIVQFPAKLPVPGGHRQEQQHPLEVKIKEVVSTNTAA